MNIVRALENTASCSNFNELIRNAKADITFWGWRHVSISYEGVLEQIPIELITERVGALAYEKNFDFTQEERAQGKILVDKINTLYMENDQALKSAFFITRILCAVREFFKKRNEGMISCRAKWIAWYSKSFDFYTPDEFKEQYGIPLSEAIRQHNGVKFNGNPSRYRLEEPGEPFIDSVGNII